MDREAMLVPGDWRPLPTPSWLTEPFWDAAKHSKLLVQRCADCERFIFRPQYACIGCLSTNLHWVESSGAGSINSYSIVSRPAYPELPSPYTVVTVELDEGWFMMSNLIDCKVNEVHIGMRVRVAFRDCGGMSLPFVEPE